MNVFKKAGFECIGWSPWEHGPTPPYAQFIIAEPIRVISSSGNILARDSCKYETYNINQVYHRYKEDKYPHKTFVWKVDTNTQNLTPLRIKPYCNIEWMFH